MPEYKDLRSFTGGLDSDSDPRNIAPEDYIEAYNISSGLSNVGGVKNMLGNTLVPYTLPSGNNTCIGSLRNIKANSIIYFVYNDSGNHSILEYMCETNTIEPILAPFTSGTLTFSTDFLGFTLENKIHSSNVLDDILIWTDNNVSPRKINIKSAKAFLNQTPPSADVFPYDNTIATAVEWWKLQFIESIKYKPFAEPSVELRFDPDRKTNYIREKMIQVKYRYIYEDNEYSRWSDGSEVTLPQGIENINGLLSNSSANNYINIGYNTGHPTVKEIQLAFRFGNTGVWARLDTNIKKYDENNVKLPGVNDYSVLYYDFYNDGVLVELVDELDNYDSVPQLSKTQEIIDGNRLVYGNNVEGYENPELDIEVEAKSVSVDMGLGSVVPTNGTPPSAGDTFYINNNTQSPGLDIATFYIPPTKPDFLVPGWVIGFTINMYDGVGYNDAFDFQYIVTETSLASYPLSLANSMRDSIRTLIDNTNVNVVVSSYGYLAIFIGLAASSVYSRYSNALMVAPTEKISTFKDGAYHAFGILYRDIEGRDGGVVTNSAMNMYAPYLPELYAGVPVDNQYAFKTNAQITLNHQPPVWAWTYEIVYAKNNLKKYTQFVIKGATPTISTNGNYELDCTYIIDYITKKRVVTSVDFQFETGDYLRFISNTDAYVSEYVEVKVLAFDESTNTLTVTPYVVSQVTNNMTTPSQEGLLCELFAYKEQISLDNRPYFGFAQTYSIVNPGTANRAHSGNTQVQVPSLNRPAIVTVDRGDSYIYRRYFGSSNSIETMIESENFSDSYDSKNIDISSVYTVIPNGKTQRYEQGIRYGGRYFPNTVTNNLLQFNGSDYDTLNTRYGPINKMVTMGYTLKVLQTKKNTSIYIDRTMIYNANGDEQITLSDKVLGTKNPSELDYGCDHPESVFVDNRQLYFFDVNTGTVIQDSANGMFPISDYKYKTFWRNLSNTIKNISGIYVYGAMDNYNGYVTLTVVDTNVTPVVDDQTIVYSTRDNRWKGNTDYIPEYYGSNALVFVSFKDGALWLHNTNEIRNSFYGTNYPTKMKFVSNVDYPKVKVFNAIAVNSNKTFYSPNIGDISIPSSVTYPDGMESRLVEAKFRWKEGVSYSEYLRDALTPNMASQTVALLNGRKLRGEVLIQEIQNNDTEDVVLYSVIIHSVGSDMSK